MSDFSEIYAELSAPFPPEKIHWRIGSKSKDGKKARLLAYLNARDVMDRLDAVVGPENWEDTYTETTKRLICTISIRVTEQDYAYPWVHKSDGAGDTNMEGEKGGISDAFKRAAVKWGIGRYLYEVDAPWIDLDARGNIPKDFDGTKYLKPVFGLVEYLALCRKHIDSIIEVKTHLANDEISEARAAFKEIPEADQIKLWRAPKFGSIWETDERAKLLKGENND